MNGSKLYRAHSIAQSSQQRAERPISILSDSSLAPANLPEPLMRSGRAQTEPVNRALGLNTTADRAAMPAGAAINGSQVKLLQQRHRPIPLQVANGCPAGQEWGRSGLPVRPDRSRSRHRDPARQPARMWPRSLWWRRKHAISLMVQQQAAYSGRSAVRP